MGYCTGLRLFRGVLSAVVLLLLSFQAWAQQDSGAGSPVPSTATLMASNLALNRPASASSQLG